MNARFAATASFVFLAVGAFSRVANADDDGARHSQLIDATRAVVRAGVREAAANQEVDRGRPAGEQTADRLPGDVLTRRCVRAAAEAAGEQPEAVANRAFVLGLGIALDDSGTIRELPTSRAFCLAVEPSANLEKRLAVIGRTTLHGRHDLLLHFAVSAYLTASLGPTAAEAVGLFKELADAQRGSGFSFVDLTADKAGIRFAVLVLRQKTSLPQIAGEFAVSDYVPSICGLPEGLSLREVNAISEPDLKSTYTRMLDEINARFDSLAVCRGLTHQADDGNE